METQTTSEKNFEMSLSVANIGAALMDFQGKVPKIEKKAFNPFLKKNYASLSNINDAIQKPLREAGLALTQFPTGDTGLVSILIHGKTGEFIKSTCDIKNVKEDPQIRGSHISYLRRYATCAILNLNIDDDSASDTTSGALQKSKQDIPGEKPWLNHGPDYSLAVKDLSQGKTINDLKTKWRISSGTMQALEKVIKELWIKRLDDVKDMPELVALHENYRKEVDEYPWLKEMFSKKRDGLKQKQPV